MVSHEAGAGAGLPACIRIIWHLRGGHARVPEGGPIGALRRNAAPAPHLISRQVAGARSVVE